MRRTGKSKTCLWRWQQRYMEEGVDGLLYDVTRQPGTPPVAPWKVREVVELTKSPPDGEATLWSRCVAALLWRTRLADRRSCFGCIDGDIRRERPAALRRSWQ